MRCDYYDAGACRSCTHLGVPYAQQLAAKDAAVRALVGEHPGLVWDEPVASRESGFRTKSTMVAAGTPDAPTLGILDAAGRGVDLSACGLLGPATAVAMPRLREFVAQAGLRPYDVPARSGELKHVHVVEASDGGLLVRFVLRSPGQIGRLRRNLPLLRELVPGVRVVSVSLLPEHKAVTAGDEEVLLSDEGTLALPVGDVTLHVMPGAFVQTNALVAGELYREAARWIDDVDPASVLDLYCGVGGFALHAARSPRRPADEHRLAPAMDKGRLDRAADESRSDHPTDERRADHAADESRVVHPAVAGSIPPQVEERRVPHGATGARARTAGGQGSPRVVHGVEVSPEAVASARRSAREAGLDATFEVGNASAYAMGLPRHELPELLVVNPPRRGIGAPLAAWLEASPVRHVLYSSCNPASLARDLAAMPSLRPVRARLFDMFPQTDHAEVLTLLRRG